jgi:hypothetical protein
MRIGRRGSGLSLAALAAALLLAAGAAGAPLAGQVTAVSGKARAAGSELAQRSGLEEDSALETEGDGACSLLVDGDALMEVCGGTQVRLRRKGGPDGPRIVQLDRGEVRMVVEPRAASERIEIHTPAAIATIIGSIIHVSVDASGVTTISSAASPVRVESSNPAVRGSTTIDAGQQIVVQPGQAPPPRGRTWDRASSPVGGCLIDFHGVSVSLDRAGRDAQIVDDAVGEDLLDSVAAGAPEGVSFLVSGRDLTEEDPVSGAQPERITGSDRIADATFGVTPVDTGAAPTESPSEPPGDPFLPPSFEDCGFPCGHGNR